MFDSIIPVMTVSNRKFHHVNSLRELKTYQVGAFEAAAHRALRQHKDALLKSYGLTGVEWYMVGTVADAGSIGIRTTDLAEALGTTQGFLTKTITLLEAKGYVYKKANAEDARSNFICINEKKRMMIEEIEVALRTKLRQSIYGKVSPEELLTYVNVIQKFSQLQ